jgi:putative ABC transport system permease protein
VVVLEPRAAGLVARRGQRAPDDVVGDYLGRVVAALSEEPGVVAVGQGAPPLSSAGAAQRSFRWEASLDRTSTAGPAGVPTLYNLIGEGSYFEALGVPLRSGRFLDGDDARAVPVGDTPAVINSALADALWPAGGAIGRSLQLRPEGGRGPGLTFRVEGVVETYRSISLDRAPEPMVFARAAASRLTSAPLLVRTRDRAQPDGIVHLEEAFHSVDPTIPLVGAEPLSRLMAEVGRDRSAALQLLGVLSIVGLFLAGLGIYGATSLGTTQRTREIGIRRALGAPARGILRVVAAKDGLWVVGGIAIGLAIAARTAPYLESMLFGVSARDPMTFAAVPAAVLVAALLAGVAPAVRAIRVDPARTLRGE